MSKRAQNAKYYNIYVFVNNTQVNLFGLARRVFGLFLLMQKVIFALLKIKIKIKIKG
jgi:hypothetical protein